VPGDGYGPFAYMRMVTAMDEEGVNVSVKAAPVRERQ